MTKNEIVERNISLTFDLLRQIIKDPSILNNIPNGKTFEFLQKDTPIHENKKKNKPAKYFKVQHRFEPV